jgi:hypothetical protein
MCVHHVQQDTASRMICAFHALLVRQQLADLHHVLLVELETIPWLERQSVRHARRTALPVLRRLSVHHVHPDTACQAPHVPNVQLGMQGVEELTPVLNVYLETIQRLGRQAVRHARRTAQRVRLQLSVHHARPDSACRVIFVFPAQLGLQRLAELQPVLHV